MTSQNTWLLPMVSFLIAYLIGSINLVILTSRALGIEALTTSGSGNPGATNLFRVAGPKIAIPVLIAELSKAFLILFMVNKLWDSPWTVFCVIPFVLGNLYPIFHGFAGGKGIAAIVGAFAAVEPMLMLMGGVVFFLMFVVFRRMSVGSLSMILSYPLWSFYFEVTSYVHVMSLIVSGIAIVTHRSNLHRLFRGEEPKLTFGSKKKNGSQ